MILTEGSVELNETNFPWTIMREHIRMEYDTNKDGILSDEENRRIAVQSFGDDSFRLVMLRLRSMSELSLTKFTNLTYLFISGGDNLHIYITFFHKITTLSEHGIIVYSIFLQKLYPTRI